MKIRFLLASVLLAAAWPTAAEESPIRVTAKPTEFPAGGATRVSITFNRQPADGGVDLPKIPGTKWHTDRVGRSNSIRIVNGRSSQSVTYTLPLSANAPGELTIPPLEVRFADGTTARSAPVRLKVLAPGEAPEPPPGPSGRIILPEGRSSFYVGEEIPVAFELAFPPGMRLTELAFPKPECDGPLVLVDLSGQNTRHPHFSDPVEGVRQTPGGTFRTLTFRTRLRFMYSGEFTLKASEQLAAAEPQQSDGFDDMDDMFFGGRFAMRSSRRMRIDYPACRLRIVTPPPPPAGTHPLGTAANCRISAGLDSRTARVGEVVELRIALSNVPEQTVLKPPTLEFPNFRVYPPEEKRLPNGGRSIRYALVPLAPGEHRLKTAFALFDPATGEWRVAEADLGLVVTGKATQTEQVAAHPQGEGKTPPRLAPRTDDDTELSLPLAKRGLIRGAAAFAVLALATLGIELVRRIRRRDPGDGARRREVAELIRRVNDGDDVDGVLRQGGLAALARGAGLPEDAPAAAVAERIGDAELREVLNDLERNSFAPTAARIERPVSAAARRTLGKLLKRALVFAALATACSAAAAECRSASGCYDAGAKYLAKGDLPRARLCLERAHRFAPRDARIETALHTVEAELGEPATRTTLRDRLRPDEYLILAGILFGAATIVAALLRKRRKKIAFAAAWFTTALGAIAAALAWSQHSGNAPYRTDRAIVTAAKLDLSSLPVAEGGRLVGTLDGGAPVVIVEERGEFVRVRRGDRDGWCRKSDVTRVFPER